MKIINAERGDVLQHPNGKFVIKHVLGFRNELNRDCVVDYQCDDYVLVHPQTIAEHNEYKISVLCDNPSVCRDYPTSLILTEIYGKLAGYRHRFLVSNYAVSVLFSAKSTDERVGSFSSAWGIRSGQFFTKVLAIKNATASFSLKGNTPMLSLKWGTSWMNIPKQ